MRGAKLCISHNPLAAAVKSRGSRKGGQNRRAIQKVTQPVEVVRIDSLTNVQSLLLQTLAGWRYKTETYAFPAELRVFQHFFSYQRPETTGF